MRFWWALRRGCGVRPVTLNLLRTRLDELPCNISLLQGSLMHEACELQVLSLPKMSSEANAFEISEIQKDETESIASRTIKVTTFDCIENRCNQIPAHHNTRERWKERKLSLFKSGRRPELSSVEREKISAGSAQTRKLD